MFSKVRAVYNKRKVKRGARKVKNINELRDARKNALVRLRASNTTQRAVPCVNHAMHVARSQHARTT